MEQSKYLIDTNAIIDYLGEKLPHPGMDFMNSIFDAVPNISVITKIEILSFNAPDDYYRFLTGFMDDASIFDLTNSITEICIDIRKKYKTKLPDAIIAATAMVYNMTLVTRNTSDFKNIQHLRILDPHNPGSFNR